MATSNKNPYLRALTLGAMSGIRSMTAPAFLSYDASRNGSGGLDGTVFSMLGRRNVANVIALMSAGEIVADKLPFIPNRTDPGPLFGRLAIGGTSGAVAFVEEDKPALIGGLIGALAALISTNVSFQVRMALSRKIPGVLAAVVGDAVALGLGLTTLRK